MKNRIAELRKTKKLTLQEVADGLGVSQGYVSQLQGKKALSAFHRTKLGEIFGVPASQVADLDENAIVRRRRGSKAAVGRPRGKGASGLVSAIATAQAAVADAAKALGADERQLLTLMASISRAHRQTLIALARSFAGK